MSAQLTLVARKPFVCHGCGTYIRDTQVRVFCDTCLGDDDGDHDDRGWG